MQHADAIGRLDMAAPAAGGRYIVGVRTDHGDRTQGIAGDWQEAAVVFQQNHPLFGNVARLGAVLPFRQRTHKAGPVCKPQPEDWPQNSPDHFVELCKRYFPLQRADDRLARLIRVDVGAGDHAAWHTARAHLAHQRPALPADYLFLSYLGDGLSTTAIHKRLMIYRQAAGVSLSAHRLRHSFANDLLAADVPVTTIQKLLGHRWLETTQVYVRANDRQVQADYYAACEKLAGWQ